jgi:hypothetical protein
MTTMGKPTLVSSNMPKGGIPYWVIKSLTTTFVEVPIKVTELARIEAKASGIRSLEALIFALRARPITTGIKKAVAAVLLINELNPAEATITIPKTRFGLLPVFSDKYLPNISTAPVRTRAAVKINKPRINMTVSLPNPANALSNGSKPVKIKVNKMPRATTSTGTHSTENSTRVIARINRRRAIDTVMYKVLFD